MDDIAKALLFSKISRVGGVDSVKTPQRDSTNVQGDFEKSLQEVLFSKHAEKRLESRSIEVSDTQKTDLSKAIGALSKKGARDSLVLMGDLAFIVNVPSKTVVTALTKDQMKEQVFTNIDSTILV